MNRSPMLALYTREDGFDFEVVRAFVISKLWRRIPRIDYLFYVFKFNSEVRK